MTGGVIEVNHSPNSPNLGMSSIVGFAILKATQLHKLRKIQGPQKNRMNGTTNKEYIKW